MTLILFSKEICPYAKKCKYVGTGEDLCFGARLRKTEFSCDLFNTIYRSIKNENKS